ncbi:MAG: dihydrolipoyl dehydrogenase [Conexivisphaerales archaeon]
MSEFELLVIGGGPGGYVCAIRAAQLGLKTAIVERDRIGGECLNYACIPSKTLINVAKLYDKVLNGSRFGIKVDDINVDFSLLQQWREQVVNSLTSGVEQLCRGNGITLLKGEAVFSDRKTVLIKEDSSSSPKQITFDKAVIATGSNPSELPNVKFDGSVVIGSKEALQLKSLPEHLLVIGGGVVGMEIACLYSKLGSRVTVVELMDQLIPGYDTDVARTLQRLCEKRNITIHLSSKVTELKVSADSATAQVDTGKERVTLQADKVLLSVGRKPRSDGIGLERLGVEVDNRGFIKTDSRMMTNVDGIFAIGDVRGPPMLAHKASKEGIVAAEVAAGIPSEALWKTVPDAIFTDPEIASAGLTEIAARASGIDAKSTRFPFAALGRALTAGETDGFVKIVWEEGSKRVIGVQIIGASASDMISEAALAIEMGATLEDIALTMHPHPTFPEALMEAAEAAAGHPIHQLRLAFRK